MLVCVWGGQSFQGGILLPVRMIGVGLALVSECNVETTPFSAFFYSAGSFVLSLAGAGAQKPCFNLIMVRFADTMDI